MQQQIISSCVWASDSISYMAAVRESALIVDCNAGDGYRQLKFMPASLTFAHVYVHTGTVYAYATHRRVTYVRTHFVSHVMKQ